MTRSDLLKELRSRTQAGMKDCHDALREANDDLEKAIDLIKIKGQNIVSGRENKTASEGLVLTRFLDDKQKTVIMLEVNCETDFVAKSPDFKQFAADVLSLLTNTVSENITFDVSSKSVTDLVVSISSKTKEKCVITKWWVEQVVNDNSKTFSYIHNGSKLGVILSMQAPSVDAVNSTEFNQLGVDLAMQIAAMNPVAVSADRVPVEVLDRQKLIFEAQLKELNKPEASWTKILEGKMNKWSSEACLLNQESVVTHKKSVQQVIEMVSYKLGGDILVINFIRCQVGVN